MSETRKLWSTGNVIFRIPRARERQTKSMYDKKSVKLNKARPAPDFSKLHSKWQDKLQDGLAKTKKPSTVVRYVLCLNVKTRNYSHPKLLYNSLECLFVPCAGMMTL